LKIHTKIKDLPNFLSSLFANTDENMMVKELMKDLIDASIDYRLLYYLKQYILKNQEMNKEFVSLHFHH
jgi:hypothetical protein